MTLRLIEAEKAEHSISRLCRVLGVSRVGFYAWRRRPPSARAVRDAELERLITAVFAESRQTYGAPRVHAELQARGVRVGKKRIARLMRQQGLEGVSRRGKRRRTTTPIQQRRPHRTWSSAASPPSGLISSGSPTSPTSRPTKAGCFSRS
jgi:putative transposase